MPLMLFSLWFSVVTEVLFGLKGWYSKGEIFITYAITVVKWTYFYPLCHVLTLGDISSIISFNFIILDMKK